MEMEAGMGSGFIWDTDGHIVTNYHGNSGRIDGNHPRESRE